MIRYRLHIPSVDEILPYLVCHICARATSTAQHNNEGWTIVTVIVSHYFYFLFESLSLIHCCCSIVVQSLPCETILRCGVRVESMFLSDFVTQRTSQFYVSVTTKIYVRECARRCRTILCIEAAVSRCIC
jgi:hypothetical protein